VEPSLTDTCQIPLKIIKKCRPKKEDLLPGKEHYRHHCVYKHKQVDQGILRNCRNRPGQKSEFVPYLPVTILPTGQPQQPV